MFNEKELHKIEKILNDFHVRFDNLLRGFKSVCKTPLIVNYQLLI